MKKIIKLEEGQILDRGKIGDEIADWLISERLVDGERDYQGYLREYDAKAVKNLIIMCEVLDGII